MPDQNNADVSYPAYGMGRSTAPTKPGGFNRDRVLDVDEERDRPDKDVQAAQEFVERVGGPIKVDPEAQIEPEAYARYHADRRRQQKVAEEGVSPFEGYEAAREGTDPLLADERDRLIHWEVEAEERRVREEALRVQERADEFQEQWEAAHPVRARLRRWLGLGPKRSGS